MNLPCLWETQYNFQCRLFSPTSRFGGILLNIFKSTSPIDVSGIFQQLSMPCVSFIGANADRTIYANMRFESPESDQQQPSCLSDELLQGENWEREGGWGGKTANKNTHAFSSRHSSGYGQLIIHLYEGQCPRAQWTIWFRPIFSVYPCK